MLALLCSAIARSLLSSFTKIRVAYVSTCYRRN